MLSGLVVWLNVSSPSVVFWPIFFFFVPVNKTDWTRNKWWRNSFPRFFFCLCATTHKSEKTASNYFPDVFWVWKEAVEENWGSNYHHHPPFKKRQFFWWLYQSFIVGFQLFYNPDGWIGISFTSVILLKSRDHESSFTCGYFRMWISISDFDMWFILVWGPKKILTK